MSDTDRVARWRQRLRDEGKEPMTIWLSHDEKLRLEDLARTRRCTTSAMVAQALAQFHPGSPGVTAPVPDAAQLRVLMQEALLETTAVTELVTDIVTATLTRDLPPLVQAIFQTLQSTPTPRQRPSRTETASVPATDANGNVADTMTPAKSRKATPARESVAETGEARVTEPTPLRKGGRPRSALGQQILVLLADHPEGLSAEQLRGILTPAKPIGDTLAGMRRLGTVRTVGHGKTLRYFAAQ